jgi:hypothetical protein
MRSLWAYAYVIVPPQPSGRLGTIRALLRDEGAAARSGERTWAGRLVLERYASHILIVSDTTQRNRSINQQLEGELDRLEATFSLTEPLAVADHLEGDRWVANYSGNGHAGNGHAR